jgi:hypothetical protein
MIPRLVLCALVLALPACEKQGVPVDSDPVDADTDTDGDTDTDADTDLAGAWAGEVGMQFTKTSTPLCEGTVALSLDAALALTGDGVCVVVGGPGKGMEIGLTFDATVDGTGAVTGQMAIQVPAPKPPPPVALVGAVTAERLDMDFAFEMPDPEDPGRALAVNGGVAATPVETAP